MLINGGCFVCGGSIPGSRSFITVCIVKAETAQFRGCYDEASPPY